MALNPHLPDFIAGGLPWQEAGACWRLDPAIFFVESERGAVRAERLAQAKAVCRECPVLQSCREHGLNAQEPYGIWGGLTPQERQATLRFRRWNTPRSEPAQDQVGISAGDC